MISQRKTLKDLINDSTKIIRAVGAHNALGAKLVEINGFDAVWASGFEISTAYARPDANILTMTEFLYAASQMVEATNLPIIADCDTGFGNVNNVIRMVKDYEKAGIAAVCIEDKLFPKMNSFISTRQNLICTEEFCNKISAAINTRVDPNFLVIARVEALIAGYSMNEALERAVAYSESGADMILIHSKQKDPSEIFEFCKKWTHKTPIVIVPTTYTSLNLVQVKEHNIKMVIYANQALRASIKAVNKVLSTLNNTGILKSIDSELAKMDELFELQGMNEMLAEEKLYQLMSIQKV